MSDPTIAPAALEIAPSPEHQGDRLPETMDATQLRLLQALDHSQRRAARPRLLRALKRPFRVGRLRLYRHFANVAPRTVTAGLFTGQTMQVVLPEPTSREIYLNGSYEPELSRVIIGHLRAGMTFVDVGTHYGYYSLLAHQLVGAQGRVVGFEPTRSTYQMVCRNTQGMDGVTIVNAGVFSSEGSMRMHDFGLFRSACNSLLAQPRVSEEERRRLPVEEYQVRVVSLDQELGELGLLPDFVKIDAESVELHVLRGMTRVLREASPMVSIETGDFGVQGAEPTSACIEFMAAQGYRCFEARGGRVTPHRPQPAYELDNLIFIKA